MIAQAAFSAKPSFVFFEHYLWKFSLEFFLLRFLSTQQPELDIRALNFEDVPNEQADTLVHHLKTNKLPLSKFL